MDINIVFEKGYVHKPMITYPENYNPGINCSKFKNSFYVPVEYSAYFYFEGFKFYFIDSPDNPSLVEASTGALVENKVFWCGEYPGNKFPSDKLKQIHLFADSLYRKTRRSQKPLGVIIDTFRNRLTIELELWLKTFLVNSL